jgi:hypothetical protein
MATKFNEIIICGVAEWSSRGLANNSKIYLRQEVMFLSTFVHVCLCVFVCQHDNKKNIKRINIRKFVRVMQDIAQGEID